MWMVISAKADVDDSIKLFSQRCRGEKDGDLTSLAGKNPQFLVNLLTGYFHNLF